MVKLERNSLRIINFVLTENEQGILSVDDIEISAVNEDTNEDVLITSLTPEQEDVLATEVANLIKRMIRYQQMTDQS